ncbi:PREDICTED: probable cytochrome P450 12a5, mitochondrial isoform X1 [Papilio polytes]|uniref:probable cytochrome P450 12a5, mitochondrial isoform X1 n=2 Tax=Papilio polytes TaxID=76194 RepID=UPI0006769D90|nr:PREDICTED: probable cytochrome P450 12a5, mitochondrial isoform X1 [Papilio polytes]
MLNTYNLRYFTAVTNNCTFRYFKRTKHLSTSNGPKPFDSIPGLSSLPFLGPIHHFMPIIGSIGPKANFVDLAHHLHTKYGNIVKLDGIFARANMVLLFQPEDFDQVYRAEETSPLRPSFDTITYYQEELRKDVYNGIFGLTAAQGEKWRDFRTKVNPVFLKPKLVKLYAPALDGISKEMIERLMKLKDKEEYLQWNFDKEVTKWSLESVAYIGLGKKLGCLRDDVDNEKAEVLIKCARDIMDFAYKLEFSPSVWRYFETPTLKKMIKTLDLQWETSASYIKEAKQKIDDRGYDIPDEDKSIIEKLLAIDEKVAILMANEMLLAGIDTVSFTTVGLLYNLASNPKVQEKLRKEILSDKPNQYLRACIKESMRLYPILPANLRRTTKEHIVGGYVIPKGIDVIAPNEFLSKMEKYYPKPLEFIPERWLMDKTDPLYYGNAHPMITQPFGFGVRSCIGRRIAEMEIETFIKSLLQEVRVSWDGPPMKIVLKVMNQLQKPYYFKFEHI